MCRCAEKEEEYKIRIKEGRNDFNIRKTFQVLISANSEETLAAGDRVATYLDFKRFFTVNGRLMQSHRIS